MRSWMLISLALGVIGCGEREATPAEASDEVQAAVDEATAAVAEAQQEANAATDEEPDPCEVLTADTIRRVYEVPAETTIENPPSHSPRPLCTYTWEKPNADEIRAQVKAQQQERIREMMRRVRGGKVGQGMLDTVAGMPSTDARVSLNFAPPSDSPEQARQRFDSARQMLAQGIRTRVQTKNVDEQIELQADNVDVEGVGDAAWWTPRLNQLAVLDGTRIFYLSVELEMEPEQNLERARQLALELLD